MDTILRSKLIKMIAEPLKTTAKKITVIGAGNVGTAIAICLLNSKICSEIVFLIRGGNRGLGEVLDLNHASNLVEHCKISATTDVKDSADSSLCIFTAGMKREKGMSRLDLLKGNVKIVQEQVPKALQYSPNAILLMITNPVDVMTYLAWKISGLPVHRVIGSGTTIDTYRLRNFVGEHVGISPGAVNATVIGEHGNNMVPCMSSIHVGNARLCAQYADYDESTDPDKTYEWREKLLKSGEDVISLKGATWWAIALSTTHIAKCIINNTNDVSPVSTNIKGLYDMQQDLYIALPCALDSSGVSKIIKQRLSDKELCDLQNAAKILLKSQEDGDKVLLEDRKDKIKKKANK